MIIKRKKFMVGRHINEVVIEKNGHFYKVLVNGDLYKTTANELFAVQVFNAI